VAVSRTALGNDPTRVVITLARPVKGPIQVTAQPGVRGASGAASASSYTTVVK
jgi:hypothetical protein